MDIWVVQNVRSPDAAMQRQVLCEDKETSKEKTRNGLPTGHGNPKSQHFPTKMIINSNLAAAKRDEECHAALKVAAKSLHKSGGWDARLLQQQLTQCLPELIQDAMYRLT